MTNRTRILFVSVVLLASMALVACAKPNLKQNLRAAKFDVPANGPELLAVYQPWFGPPDHIDVGYSTHDPVVIAKQIDEARKLGIDGFVVNWYGPRKQYMDKSHEILQRLASEKNFKIGIMYDEDASEPHLSTEKVLVDLQYAYDRYIAAHAPVPHNTYLRYRGRPVIFIFPKKGRTDWARVRKMTDSWEDPPLLIYKHEKTAFENVFDGFFAWVHPGNKGWAPDGSNWGEDYLKNYYSTMNSKYQDKIAVGAAWPGFDDRQAHWSRNRRMDARCGKTFEETLRMFRRYYDSSRPLPFMLIVTWNDYEEGTAIERGLPTCG
jgi:hypothetical protein